MDEGSGWIEDNTRTRRQSIFAFAADADSARQSGRTRAERLGGDAEAPPPFKSAGPEDPPYVPIVNRQSKSSITRRTGLCNIRRQLRRRDAPVGPDCPVR